MLCLHCLRGPSPVAVLSRVGTCSSLAVKPCQACPGPVPAVRGRSDARGMRPVPMADDGVGSIGPPPCDAFLKQEMVTSHARATVLWSTWVRAQSVVLTAASALSAPGLCEADHDLLGRAKELKY